MNMYCWLPPYRLLFSNALTLLCVLNAPFGRDPLSSTILREHDKVAWQCAAEQMDYQHYLLRLTELELLHLEPGPLNAVSGKRSSRSSRPWTASTSWPSSR